MLSNLLKNIRSNTNRIFKQSWTVCTAFSLIVLGTSLASADGWMTLAGTSAMSFESVAAQPPSTAYGASGYSAFPAATPAPTNILPTNTAPDRFRGRDPDTNTRTWPLPVEAPKPDEIQRRLSQRYSDPVVVRFVQSTSADRAFQLYREATQLIDSRHLEPASYQSRVWRALENLSQGVENSEFLQANRISPSGQQVNAFRDAIGSLKQSRSVQNSSDTFNVLYGAIDLANRYVGLKPTAVAMEFVYASVESLDKYSAFEPDDTYRAPSAGLDELGGQIVGIGVEIKPHDDGVLVVKPLRGGPAAEAGLQPGDVIVSINGRRLGDENLQFAVDQIKGRVGTPLLLGVRRDGQMLAPVSLVRRSVTIYSVSSIEMLDSEVGYIKLDQFAKNSSAEMDEALWSLYRQGMKSLVFDLRGNPGGLLTTAIELSNKFLPCGSIVSTRGRTASDQSAEHASYDRTWKIPLVVLVDENSASASEIFAAAIQENGRGIVVGRRSYGKGTVQTHFPLQSVSGNLRLTTARFYSPNGRVMAGSGVTPDVEVAKPADAIEFVRLSEDRDVQAAVEVATGNEVRQMANSKSNCRTNVSMQLQG